VVRNRLIGDPLLFLFLLLHLFPVWFSCGSCLFLSILMFFAAFVAFLPFSLLFENGLVLWLRLCPPRRAPRYETVQNNAGPLYETQMGASMQPAAALYSTTDTIKANPGSGEVV